MSKYTKYKLYQKYETRGSQEAIPCYPNVFSIDGDGTMPLVIVEENSRDCGYTGETQPIYRWYTLPIETYYVCDACQDGQYRWVNLPISQDWECVGTTKYYKQKKQVSVDGGSTWTDVVPPQYQRGAVYETSSQSCGYRTRTTTGSPYCTGYDKYVNVYTETSSDGGSTWITASTNPTLVEHNSSDCGYVPPSPAAQYLTLVAKSSGNIKATTINGGFQYSYDSGTTWYTNSSYYKTFNVYAGDSIMFKGTLSSIGSQNKPCMAFTGTTCRFEAEGNPMSVVYGDNFVGQTSLRTHESAFSRMFSGCTGLTSIENLSLPATTLATVCYENMFRGCTRLTSIPSSLLPATTLADSCYLSMFYGCTSLTKAPDLPAPTLAKECYSYMFCDCSSLNYIKCLATNISARNSTYFWVEGVSSSGTFVKASSATWPSGYDSIPQGWTVQNA